MEDELGISVPKSLSTPLHLLCHSLGHSSCHLLHHNIDRISLARSLLSKACAKSLGKNFAYVLITESLPENFVDVDVIKPTSGALSKLIVAPAFAFIAKRAVRLADVLEGVHCAWRPVFIWVDF